jgi:hypothetical protein
MSAAPTALNGVDRPFAPAMVAARAVCSAKHRRLVELARDCQRLEVFAIVAAVSSFPQESEIAQRLQFGLAVTLCVRNGQGRLEILSGGPVVVCQGQSDAVGSARENEGGWAQAAIQELVDGARLKRPAPDSPQAFYKLRI